MKNVCMNGLPLNGCYSPFGNYASTVGALDTMFDATGSSYLGFGPMSMCGSIMPMQFGAGNCCGYGPGSELMNMSLEGYTAKMNQLEDMQIERQVNREHRLEAAEFRSKAPNDVIANKIGVLHDLAVENNQDQVAEKFAELEQAVRGTIKDVYHLEPDAQQVKAYAQKLYAKNIGRNVIDDLRDYGDSPFWSGAKKAAGGIGWLFMDKKTSDENIADISGKRIPRSDKAKEVAGMVTSGLLTAGAAILGCILLKGKFAKAAAKTASTAAA